VVGSMSMSDDFTRGYYRGATDERDRIRSMVESLPSETRDSLGILTVGAPHWVGRDEVMFVITGATSQTVLDVLGTHRD
jgi:hypothetical protein